MIEVYLNFDGNCKEAVEFYAEVFKTPLQPMMTYGDIPEYQDLPEAARNRILHTFLMVGGSRIMFSDMDLGAPLIQGNNFSVTYSHPDVKEIERVFKALSIGGEVLVALEENFFSKAYGVIKDKFGIFWQVTASKEQ